MSTRTCKVGIHGRNHEEWGDLDFQVLRDARIEVVKAMSQTRPQYFERAKRENDRIEIITRLHGDGFGVCICQVKRGSPALFVKGGRQAKSVSAHVYGADRNWHGHTWCA